MPLNQANAFRDYVSQNEDVQKEIRSALMTESAKVSEIAAKHGFTFTSEEGKQAWDTAQDNELSDFELDMVAGEGNARNGGSYLLDLCVWVLSSLPDNEYLQPRARATRAK